MKPAVCWRRSGRDEKLNKVLITGGAGFIGGFLAQAYVRRGHTVSLVDNLTRGREDRFLRDLVTSGRVYLLRRDLKKDGALDDLGTDYMYILHLAAVLGVQNVLSHPYETLRDNVRMLEAALAFAGRQRRLQRFLFASTSEVYAGSLELMDMPIPTPEETPLALSPLDHPRSSYMLSKVYGEAMVRHAGVPFTVVRPHNLYGPRMGRSHVIPQLLEKAYHAPWGAGIEVFSVDHRRTFCFIDDAVEMIVRATERPGCAGHVLNVGSQSPEITIGDLAHLVIVTVGKDLTIEARPPTPGSPVRRCPDMTRTANLTGYCPCVGLEDGVRRTYEWYKEMVFEGAETQVAT